MSKSNRLDLTREAFIKAWEHQRAADVIASMGYYPMAFSHLVLELEEIFKGVYLYNREERIFQEGEFRLVKLPKRSLYKHWVSRKGQCLSYLHLRLLTVYLPMEKK